MAIISTAEFKTYKTISVSTYDTLIGVLIAAAQEQVEDFCGRVFDTATFTEYASGDTSETIQLRNYPVASITSLAYVDNAGTATSTFASTDFTFDPVTGLLRLAPVVNGRVVSDGFEDHTSVAYGPFPNFNQGFRNLKIVYVGGYGSNPAYAAMPAGLKLAMYQFVDELFLAVKDGNAANGLFKSETLDAYSYDKGEVAETFSRFYQRFARYRRGML